MQTQRTQTQVDIIAQNSLTNATNHVGNLMKNFPHLYEDEKGQPLQPKDLAIRTAVQIKYFQNEFKKIIAG
jgi:hypothetical protein